MKKMLIVLAALCLMMTAVLAVSAASDVKYGDTNSDGKVNNKDLAALQQYLSDWDVDMDEDAADVNHDGKINNKDLALMQQYLADWDVTLEPEEPETDDDYYNDTELDWNF